MNFRAVSPDASLRYDPPLMRMLGHLPSGNGPAITVMPITRLDNFVFRQNLAVDGPWVLFDFTEFGWDWTQVSSYKWPFERLAHPGFAGDEWKRFSDFIAKHPPACIFQRELLQMDATNFYLPVEYPNYFPVPAPQSEDQFMSRPIDVMFNWGRSHEDRPRVHGDIFRESGRLGYSVASQFEHLQAEIKESRNPIWAAIHTPHYARIPVEETVRWFGQSKIVIAMNGAGVKTFRHGEIPNSIIALPEDHLAWSIGMNKTDCIRFSKHSEVAEIAEHLKLPSLYSIYQHGLARMNRLHISSYMPEYLLPAILPNL